MFSIQNTFIRSYARCRISTTAINKHFSSATCGYEHIEVSRIPAGVGMIKFKSDKSVNLLSGPLMKEFNRALSSYDEDKATKCIVISGDERSFAAGADITEMTSIDFGSAYQDNFLSDWSHLANSIRKPVIAAVSGYALGGGFELALMCDIMYCTTTATLGLPEVKLGTIPGAGGSQRLAKAVGKSRAMELILTGRYFSGEDAANWGIAAKAFDGGYEELINETVKVAETLSGLSQISLCAGKEVVNKSQDLSLRDGVEFERRLFHGLFGSKDQKIGMAAFVTKERPEWTNK